MNSTLPKSDHKRTSIELCPPETNQTSLDSDDIFRGQKVVEIKHNGVTYRLQATRLGKLILTK